MQVSCPCFVPESIPNFNDANWTCVFLNSWMGPICFINDLTCVLKVFFHPIGLQKVKSFWSTPSVLLFRTLIQKVDVLVDISQNRSWNLCYALHCNLEFLSLLDPQLVMEKASIFKLESQTESRWSLFFLCMVKRSQAFDSDWRSLMQKDHEKYFQTSLHKGLKTSIGLPDICADMRRKWDEIPKYCKSGVFWGLCLDHSEVLISKELTMIKVIRDSAERRVEGPWRVCIGCM